MWQSKAWCPFCNSHFGGCPQVKSLQRAVCHKNHGNGCSVLLPKCISTLNVEACRCIHPYPCLHRSKDCLHPGTILWVLWEYLIVSLIEAFSSWQLSSKKLLQAGILLLALHLPQSFVLAIGTLLLKGKVKKKLDCMPWADGSATGKPGSWCGWLGMTAWIIASLQLCRTPCSEKWAFVHDDETLF